MMTHKLIDWLRIHFIFFIVVNDHLMLLFAHEAHFTERVAVVEMQNKT